MDEQSTAAGTVDKPEVKNTADVVSLWLKQITLASDDEKEWRDKADRYSKKYALVDKGDKAQFNIFYSNTQTLAPALYSNVPTPDVRRRYSESKDAARTGAQVIERALSFSMEDGGFHEAMQRANLTHLITGRGVTRVKYVPFFTEPDEDEGDETLAYENVAYEDVPWQDFRRGPASRWADVPWIAFRHAMRREDLEEAFGEEMAAKVTLNYTVSDEGNENKQSPAYDHDMFKRALVWEIWDKERREVLFIAETVKDEPLAVRDDPLGLQGFFPIPEPLLSTPMPSSLVPIPEYEYYENQGGELDLLTQRINQIATAVKFRGVYDGAMGDALGELMDKDDNSLFPITDGASFSERGGISGSIWMWPTQEASNVLIQLYQQRDQLKQTIYEITGISDIVRGASDARETATAQQIKSQYGGLRLKTRQSRIARYARDLLRLSAEIIAEHFQPETLALMTNTQEIDESVMEVLRSDVLRNYLIDIETDSTIESDVQLKQKAIGEFSAGLGSFITSVGPAVQSGEIPKEFVITLIKSFASTFKLGKEVENMLDSMGEEDNPLAKAAQLQQELQQCQQQLQQAQEQLQQVDQAKMAESQAKVAEGQAKTQNETKKTDADIARGQAELQFKGRELDIKEQELTLKAKELELKAIELQMQRESEQVSTITEAANKDADRAQADKHKQQDMDIKANELRIKELETDIKRLQAERRQEPKESTSDEATDDE